MDELQFLDLECDDEVSAEQIEYWLWTGDDFPDPDLEPTEWLEAAIEANPGIWTAELCRTKHNIPSDNQGIAFCGLCKEYANPRKRARSEALGPELPGFETWGGAFKLHKACSRKGLTWLRKTLSRWSKQGKVEKIQNAKIPDIRQPRGWDFGSIFFWKGDTPPMNTQQKQQLKILDALVGLTVRAVDARGVDVTGELKKRTDGTIRPFSVSTADGAFGMAFGIIHIEKVESNTITLSPLFIRGRRRVATNVVSV